MDNVSIGAHEVGEIHVLISCMIISIDVILSIDADDSILLWHKG